MNRERFRFFHSTHHQSDLLIGVPHDRYKNEMAGCAMEELIRLRKLVSTIGSEKRQFISSHKPIGIPANLATELQTMCRCAIRTGTGPMSSVAGLFAEKVGKRLVEAYKLEEIIVENGGDLYTKHVSDLVSVIHAGESPLSGRVAFILTPGSRGVCTSAGTVGHSYSYGKADAVTVICESTPLADAWATALGNRIGSAKDIEPVLDEVQAIPEIIGCAVIVKDLIGIRGEFKVKLLP